MASLNAENEKVEAETKNLLSSALAGAIGAAMKKKRVLSEDNEEGIKEEREDRSESSASTASTVSSLDPTNMKGSGANKLIANFNALIAKRKANGD